MTLLSFPKRLIHRLGNLYAKEICRREYLAQEFLGINERPVEYRFVFEQLTRVFPKTVLDVGTGKTALPQLMRTCGFLVTAMDNVKDYWPHGMVNRHYHVLDDDILDPRVSGPFDVVTCVSTLEHIRDHDRAVRMMFSLLRPGGWLVLTFPYNENTYVENVYALPGSVGADKFAFITQVFSRREIDRWVRDNEATLVAQEFWRFFYGPFWTIGGRVVPPVRVEAADLHQISCITLVKDAALISAVS
jgi:2-polyprenyl-3-methyl-5-hydroxy-6-metoxy-1,4-benzoquinol methylase